MQRTFCCFKTSLASNWITKMYQSYSFTSLLSRTFIMDSILFQTFKLVYTITFPTLQPKVDWQLRLMHTAGNVHHRLMATSKVNTRPIIKQNSRELLWNIHSSLIVTVLGITYFYMVVWNMYFDAYSIYMYITCYAMFHSHNILYI